MLPSPSCPPLAPQILLNMPHCAMPCAALNLISIFLILVFLIIALQILLNKTDLVSKVEVAALHKRIHRINTTATITECTYSK